MVTMSPVYFRGEKLCKKVLIIWLKLDGIDRLITFAVQVVRVESANGFKRLVAARKGLSWVNIVRVPNLLFGFH